MTLGHFSFILSTQIMVLATSSSNLLQAPNFYIDRIKVSLTSPTYFTQQLNGYNFSLAWRQPLPSPIQSSGVALYNYKMIASSMLSFQAKLFDLNLTEGVLYFNPKRSQPKFGMIAFSVLVVTEGNNYAQIIQVEASSGNSFACYQYMYGASKFIFRSSSPPSISCYLSSLIFAGLQSSYFKISCSAVNNNAIVEVKFCCSSYVDVRTMKVTVVVINMPTQFTGVLYHSHWFSASHKVQCGNQYCSWYGYYGGCISYSCSWYYNDYILNRTNLGVLPIYGSTETEYHCIYGFKYLTTGFDQSSDLDFLSSGSQYDSYYVYNYHQIQITCLARCPLGYEPHNSNTTCGPINCTVHMQSCIICYNYTSCLACYLGSSVIGGCSKIVGCIEVEQKPSPFGAISTCSDCRSEFKLDVDHVCQCKQGHLAGEYCTNVTGCINAQNINDKVVCLSCNFSQKYELDTTTQLCVCKQGYFFNGTNCQQICGDGVVYELQCDDGNTVSGDGCSSTCQQQIYYDCQLFSPKDPSLCRYVNFFVTVALVRTEKTQGLNQGIFTFKFSEPLPPLVKYNFSSYFSFECSSAEFQVVSWTYSPNGQVSMVVDYQTDLEKQQATATFAFHNNYVVHPPMTLHFEIRSDDDMLIVQFPTTPQVVAEYFFFGSSIFALLLVLLGSWVQKMIGAEFINSLQLIYFLHFSVVKYTSTYKSLKKLSFAGFSLLSLMKQTQTFTLSESLQKEAFSMEIAEYVFMVFGICFAIIGILWGCLSAVSCLTQEEELAQKCSKTSEKVYNYIALPFAAALLVPLFLILPSFFYKSNADSFSFPSQIRLFIILAALSGESFVVGREFRKFFTTRVSRRISYRKGLRPRYPAVFFLYLIFQEALIFVWLRLSLEWSRFALLTICSLMLIWQLLSRPYASLIDNFGIFCNVASGIGFQVILLLKDRQKFDDSQSGQILICYITMGLIGLCELLVGARLVKGICSMMRQKKNKKKKKSKQKKREDEQARFEEQEIIKKYEEGRERGTSHFVRYITGQQVEESKRKFSVGEEIVQNHIVPRTTGKEQLIERKKIVYMEGTQYLERLKEKLISEIRQKRVKESL